MSKKNPDENQLLWSAVASALMLDFEHLSQVDLQSMAGVDEGNISRQIRNIHERVNRTYSIVKFNPFKVGDKQQTLIEIEKLDEFNDLVDDYFILEQLIKDIFNPDRASLDLYETYEKVLVPKYEKQVNELLKKEVPNKTWEDIQHSHVYLRKLLLRKIMRLGHILQGQVALSLVQTLPREEIERLTRQINRARRGMEWE